MRRRKRPRGARASGRRRRGSGAAAALALAALAFHLGLVLVGLELFGIDEAVAVGVVRAELLILAFVGGGELGLGDLVVLVGIHLVDAALAFAALSLGRLLAAAGAEHVARAEFVHGEGGIGEHQATGEGGAGDEGRGTGLAGHRIASWRAAGAAWGPDASAPRGMTG